MSKVINMYNKNTTNKRSKIRKNRLKINNKNKIIFKKQKNSQVTLFIIIGIVSIIVVVALLTLFKPNFFNSLTHGNGDAISNVVQQCLKSSAKNGINILELQGGHIYLGPLSPYQYINLGFKIPIWDPNMVPTLDGMNNELTKYVQNNTLGCIYSNIQSLQDKYNISINASKFKVNLQINNNNVIINAILPIKFNEKGSNGKNYIDDFSVKIDNVKLKSMSELAKAIYNKEEATQFLENLVIEQIMDDSDYSSKTSMPSEGMEFSCAKRVWTYPQLMFNLINLNNNNFRYLSFEGTYQPKVPKADTGYYNNKAYYNAFYRIPLENLPPNANEMVVSENIPVSANPSNFLKSVLTYFKTFEVIPNDGGVVTSMTMDTSKFMKLPFGFAIPIPCIQYYHHLYNLNYPILFKIRDLKTGTFFEFPLRVNIHRSLPAKVSSVISLIPEKRSNYINYQESFCPPKDINQLKKLLGNNTIVNVKKYPMRIYIEDKESGRFLNNVNITEKCVGLECNIGSTTYPLFHGIKLTASRPYLYANFSYCVNGKIVAQKEGYYSEPIYVNIDDKLLQRSQTMTPTYTIDMTKILKLAPNVVALGDVSMNGDLTLRTPYHNQGDVVYIFLKANQNHFSSFTVVTYDKEYDMYPQFKYLKILNNPDITYNITAYYMGSNGKLLGMKIENNWKPQSLDATHFDITILGYENGIPEKDFVNYFKKVKDDNKPLTVY